MSQRKLSKSAILHEKSDKPESLKSIQLALLSQAILDIPPRTRFVLTLSGFSGIMIIIVESLVGGRGHTIHLDKILHFSGYAIISAVFILALRPRYFIPVLILLFSLGIIMEFLQSKTGRSPDMIDQLANVAGIGIGAGIGLIIRYVYAYIKTELAAMNARRSLVRYEAGEVILCEGDPIKKFYIIKKGHVQVTRKINGQPIVLTDLGPGEVIGALGVIEGTPQYTTVKAISEIQLYGMNLKQLMDSAGGKEQPVSTVLRALAAHLRDVIEKRAQAEARLEGRETS